MAVLDYAVAMSIAQGEQWVEIAAALGLSESETRRRYEALVAVWLDQPSPGLDLATFGRDQNMHPDVDPEGTAASLDQWFARHREPWEGPASTLGILYDPLGDA